ncbi:hypothetical protein GQ457_13G022820 [Hibiscus cannabinus]
MGCLYSVFDVKKYGKLVWVVRARNWKLRGGENRLSGLLEGVSLKLKFTIITSLWLRRTLITRLCKSKSMLVVNGRFPGPTIYVHKGDTVFVNVHNHGDYGLTIHWHGVKQPRNPWSDGSAYITQCPIDPGRNFTYEVMFSEEEGTLWWHANSNTDWTRNTVHGAIIVYPPHGSSYPFPTPQGEQILIFGTWFTYDVNKVIREILRTGKDVPISDAYIINGQPGDFCACSKGHNLTVVGIDGSYLKPFTTNYVMLATGQTIDVLIEANQSPGHYYMAGRQYYTDNLFFTGYDKTNATAILKYRGRYNRPSSLFLPETLPSYTDYDSATRFRKRLKSLASKEHPIDVPRNVTTRMYITASMDRINHADMDYTLLSSLNNISWVNPLTDVLQAYYRNLSGLYTSDFPDEPPYYFNFVADLGDTGTHPLQGTKLKILEYGEEVEIVFQSTNLLNASDEHSMYIHGHKFYVLGEGYGNFNSTTDPETYNLVDPPYLSTVSLPVKGWLTIRFKADNPVGIGGSSVDDRSTVDGSNVDDDTSEDDSSSVGSRSTVGGSNVSGDTSGDVGSNVGS